MATGASQRVIAEQLGISHAAVGTNIKLILEKLGARTRVEAVARHFLPDKDAELRIELRRLPPSDRWILRRFLAAKKEDREAIASEGLKRQTEGSDDLAEHLAWLTTHPEEHQRFTRVLRQIEAGSRVRGVDDAELKLALSAIEPKGRELLRRYLIADQPDRDALPLRLFHEGTEHAAWLADLIDTLTMHPDQRRRVVRLLGELGAGS